MSVPNRRTLLLRAAHQVLLHYGPRKTTIGDIATAAGVSVGSVYLEFPSKAALLAAVYDNQLEDALAKMRAAARDPPGDLALRAAIDARTRVYWGMGRGGAHAQDIARPYCKSVRAVWIAHRVTVRGVLLRLLERGVSAGDLHTADVGRAADALMNVYAAFEPPRLGDAEFDRVQTALDAVHGVVLDGLRPR